MNDSFTQRGDPAGLSTRSNVFLGVCLETCHRHTLLGVGRVSGAWTLGFGRALSLLPSYEGMAGSRWAWATSCWPRRREAALRQARETSAVGAVTRVDWRCLLSSRKFSVSRSPFLVNKYCHRAARTESLYLQRKSSQWDACACVDPHAAFLPSPAGVEVCDRSAAYRAAFCHVCFSTVPPPSYLEVAFSQQCHSKERPRRCWESKKGNRAQPDATDTPPQTSRGPGLKVDMTPRKVEVLAPPAGLVLRPLASAIQGCGFGKHERLLSSGQSRVPRTGVM